MISRSDLERLLSQGWSSARLHLQKLKTELRWRRVFNDLRALPVPARVMLGGAGALGLFMVVSCTTVPEPEDVEPEFDAGAEFGSVRSLWVTRWDYGSAADLERIVQISKELGMTEILFQVRGQADAFYPSELEVWGADLLRKLPEGQDVPDFDPLEEMIRLAHAEGIKVQAWINMMPLWKGTEPPENPEHLFNARPEWRLRDKAGNMQPLHDHYVIVNPVLPEVHAHLEAVALDIASRYNVDGIHMDYIRFVAEGMEEGAGYPADAQSHALFRERTGLHAAEAEAEYRLFVQDRISELVRGLSETLDTLPREVPLTAAVWRDYNIGRKNYLQDWPTWAENGWLDAAYPMIYIRPSNSELYAPNVADAVAASREAALVVGIGAYLHDDPQFTIGQLETARDLGANGYAIFAYSTVRRRGKSYEALRQYAVDNGWIAPAAEAVTLQ